MPFPLLFGLLGLGSLLAPAGMAKTAAGAISLGKNIYDQINLSDPTLKERVLTAIPFEAGPKIEKGLGSLFRTGGAGAGGGGGDDGGGGAIKGDVDFFGRPFFDPGFGSPAQNIQFGGTGSGTRTGVPEAGLESGAGVSAVTTENLFSPGELNFGFNQGGLVSLLPRRATPVRSPPISYRRY